MAKRHWKVGNTLVSLESILLNEFEYPLNYSLFYSFCCLEHSEENILIWKEIYDWKSNFSLNLKEINIENGKKIINNYIGKNAKKQQINLPANLENEMLNQSNLLLLGENIHFFDNILKEIEKIIYSDVFPRYINKVECILDHERSKALALWCFHISEIHSFFDFFHFPHVINEAESRIHQYLAGFLMISFVILGIYTKYWYVYLYIVYGYFIRIISGPKFCPNAWLVLFVLSPIVQKYHLMESEIVPSAPKRFAQFIGLIFSILYCVLMYLSYPLIARILAGIHIVLSLLAAVTSYCLGCHVYLFIESCLSKIKQNKYLATSQTITPETDMDV